MFLREATAVTVKIGPFVDSTDAVTAETGLTIAQADVRLSKNGGAYAQKTESTSCTHDENGEYGCPLDATDTGTCGRLKLVVMESGACPVWHEYTVIAAEVYDSIILGTNRLETDARELGGSTIQQSGGYVKISSGTGDGQLNVSSGVVESDMTYIHGSALSETAGQLAGRFSDFFDQAGAGYNVSTALSSFKATGFSTHDAAAVKTAIEADGSKIDHLWEMTEDDAGTRRLTANALEEAPDSDTTTGLTLHSDYDAAKTAAQAGDAMTLAADAIKATSYDESTAFPVKSADTGATQIARVGADGDTLEDLSDEIAAVAATVAGGIGAVTFTYTVYEDDGTTPVPDCHVWVCSDEAGANELYSGTSDDNGEVVFYLDNSTTYYFFRKKAGWNFTNPDTETVSGS